MPLPILVALAVVSLTGFTIAVIATVLAEARSGAAGATSLTYRAYGA